MQPSKESLKSVRVLVVDDEEDIRSLTAVFLSRHGAEVVQADSVASAKAILSEQKPFEIVLCDYKMPGEPGSHLITHLKENNFAGKFILITGHMNYGSSELENAKPDMILQKPISFDVIVAKVLEAFLSISRS